MKEKREFNPTLQIDPEFERQIPPLTDDEYKQLEENIVSEGVVLMPLIVWNGTIVDGHNRYKIVRAHPHIRFDVIEKDFINRYEVLAWICKNQLGRRNLTLTQKRLLIGDQYEAEKMAHGEIARFRSNNNSNFPCGQNDHMGESGKTRKKIAAETNTSESFVKRAGQYSRGATAGEEVSPGFRQEVLSGKIKPTQKMMWDIARASPEERKRLIRELRETTGTPPEENEPRMTAQDAVQEFEWKVTRVLQNFDNTFIDWPQLITDEPYRAQVVATLQDLKQYILHIEGGTHYEWDREARKISV